MGSANRQFSDNSIQDRKRKSNDRGRSYQYEPCNSYYPILGALGGAFATGATGTTGRWMAPGGDVLMHYKGAGQTILGPTVDSSNGRLSVALDQTNTEGVEYYFDSILAGTALVGRQPYKVGTSNPRFGKLKLLLEDVSGLGECAFGLREAEAFTANLDDYTDLACLNVQNGVINHESITNNAATVTTNTGATWADGAEKTISYTIGLGGAGRVKFYVDGIQRGPNYDFTSGLVLAPFAFYLQGADLSQVYWTWFELGAVRDVERGL
jgi:hypothetical protein